jgi:GT2 family glycosyltransferase
VIGLSFVIPARNRPTELATTLDALARRPVRSDAREEVIVLDNASDPPLEIPERLANGTEVIAIRLAENEGAAARNRGVEVARAEWVVMLDDDSSPMSGDLHAVLAALPPDVAAVGGEIFLPSGYREAGGLPEVIIGCGCAIRRDVFLALGGYDASFGFYVEEYDLCARLLLAGHRVCHTRALTFEHRKTPASRSMDLILGRLVRNNGWTIQRYAPKKERGALLDATIERYRSIAEKEHAREGFDAGLAELQRTIHDQPDREMRRDLWDRFTGYAAAQRYLSQLVRENEHEIASVVGKGKGVEIIEEVLRGLGVSVRDGAALRIAGSLSPGPMLDTVERDPGTHPAWRLEE